MQHKGAATRTLINIDISSRRHIGYAIIAKCSASAQVISGGQRTPCQLLICSARQRTASSALDNITSFVRHLYSCPLLPKHVS